MNVFLDANIVVGLLNKRDFNHSLSVSVLKICQLKKITTTISPITVAIAFYFFKKSFIDAYSKKDAFEEFLSVFSYSSNLSQDISESFKINFEDIEDALQYI